MERRQNGKDDDQTKGLNLLPFTLTEVCSLTVSGYFPKYGWWQAYQRLSVYRWIKNNESASLL